MAARNTGESACLACSMRLERNFILLMFAPTDSRAIDAISKLRRITGASWVNRPLWPSDRPFFIVLSRAHRRALARYHRRSPARH